MTTRRTSRPPIVPAPTPAPVPSSTAGLGRRLALCLSLATLFYLRQVSFWAVPKNRYYVHWQRSDALMLVLGVVVCAVLLFAVAELVRRIWPDRAGAALRWLTVLFMADVVVGYAAAGSRHDAVPSSWAAVAWVAVAGIGLYLSGRVPRVTEAGTRVLSALVWLAPISLVQMLSWKSWDVRPTVADAARPPAPHAGTNPTASVAGPVFIFVFDEWSYQRSYADGQLLPFFEHLRRFAAHSFEFTDAHSQAGGTTISLPRLLFQRPGELRVGNGTAAWVTGDSAVPSTRLPSLFTEAAARGYVTSIDGFYLPYRAILGDQVDTIRSEPHIPKGQTVPERVWVGLVRNLGYLADPLGQQVWARWYARAYSDNWARMNREMRDRVKRMIRAARANTFTLVHWPLPHAPFVFNADGSYRGPFQTGRMEGTPDDYRRHLQVLDATFGEIVAEMEAAGVFDSALIVVTSDHSWKAEPETRFTARADAATWVPLFVKLPGQVVGERVGASFCLGQLASVLARVVEGASLDTRTLSELGDALGPQSCLPNGGVRLPAGWTIPTR